MINHNPEVKEQLERLGVPVLVERSSYEANPLGRMEWIKLYGCCWARGRGRSRLDQAAAAAEALAAGIHRQERGLLLYQFHGHRQRPQTGDYVAEMIRMAGGSYLPDQPAENDNALSTMNMDMESFYQAAREATS